MTPEYRLRLGRIPIQVMEAFAYKDSKKHGSGMLETKLNKPEQWRKYMVGDRPQKH